MNNIFLRTLRRVQKLNAGVLLATSLVFSNAVLAIDIAQSPLFIDKSATPNIMFIMDDSGSMDWDILVGPHYEAYNYDRDANRSWARGGRVNGSYRNLAPRTHGDIVSYPGGCQDRNVDGICDNQLDLNGDGDTGDTETPLSAGQVATYEWKLRLSHRYHWNYPQGWCKPPAAGSSDARKFLPSFERVLTFLTGSSSANAHSYTGTSWNAVGNKPTAGFTHANYDIERWQSKSPWNTYILTAGEAAEKAVCDAKTDGSTWHKVNAGRTLIHEGADAWVSPGSIADPSATSYALAGYVAGVEGSYHTEDMINMGDTFIAGTPAFDINGDNIVSTAYRERDAEAAKRVGYEYLTWNADNVYYSASQPSACNSGSTKYNSPQACKHLQYTDYPAIYAFDAIAPAIAPANNHPGNENILELPANVPRMIQAVWPSPPPALKRFDNIPWSAWSDASRGIAARTSPEGTRHALNKWDPWPLVAEWRFRTSSLNVLYYNPDLDYDPWPGLPATTAGAFTQTAGAFIRSNPQPASAGYATPHNLARIHGAEEGGFVYEIWHDDAGYWSSKPQWNNTNRCGLTGGWRASSYAGAVGVTDPATGNVVVGPDRICSTYKDVPNGEVDLWDTRDRVTVYVGSIVVQTVRRTPHIFGESINTNAGNKYFMSDTRVSSTVTYNAGSTYPIDGFCETVLGVDPDNLGNCKTVEQVQANVGTWFEYSRRRSFVAKGAIGALVSELPDLNYGLMGTSRDDTVSHNKVNAADLTLDISKLFLDVYDGTGSGNGNVDRVVHNEAIRTNLYDHVFRQSGTPLRQALQRAGEYFAGRGPVLGIPAGVDDHSTSPITESCQKNFALLLTDGYWSGLAPADVVGTDASGAAISLNNADADPYTQTLADVARYYYNEDLSGLPNEVPTDTFDTNDAQHLTTIGVGFGVKGALTDANNNGWPGNVGGSALEESDDWGQPNINSRKIDDLWHAAYNSRGKYYKADNPVELIDQLRNAVLTALAASGSASALSANSTVLTSSTRIYQTLFKSGDWTGEIKSLTINGAGLLNPVPEWTAQAQLDARTFGNRKIVTLNAAGVGIPFRWANLTAPAQRVMLRTRYGTNVVEPPAFGQATLRYIRGQGNAQFRTRAHTLGDIVHSEPVYVGRPRYRYPDSWHAAPYSTFRATHAARTPMLYVGANDGMMHAFDAATGAENYAYIPSIFLPDLNALAHKPNPGQDYSHRYYVDSSPVSGDVFFGAQWRTVLVGGLGGGGKGIYALDVTTVPGGGASEMAIAGNKALWEFTDSDDADMGFSFSKPNIVRLNNGNWAAVFGNGYNSANHKAVLYIVEFDTTSAYGTVHKFSTAIGDAVSSNGMSTPTLIDTDGDMIVDRIYAGDLLGNVWNIDISSANENQWKFSYNTQGQSNNHSFVKTPMFTASDGAGGLQPITAPIAISEHPAGPLAGFILNFGTGKYLGTSDNNDTGQVTQTMYGLWDYGDDGITRGDLLTQEVLADLYQASSQTSLRVTSANGPVNWIDAGHTIGESGWESHVDHKGWLMDLTDTTSSPLDNHGERVVSRMLVRGGGIILSTLLPAADPCDGGGSGWTMTLNAATGSRFSNSPFDINGDGVFDSDDFADWTDSAGDSQNTAISGVKSDSGIPSTPLLLNTPGGGAVSVSDRSSGRLPTSGGSDTFGSATCSVANGTCTLTAGANPGDPPMCTTSIPGETCTVSGHCPGGVCAVSGFSDIGRQSWIQLE